MKEGKSFVGVEQLIRDDIHLLLLCAKSSEVKLIINVCVYVHLTSSTIHYAVNRHILIHFSENVL